MTLKRLQDAVGTPLQERLSVLGLSEAMFMSMSQPRLMTLVEKHGQETVLRELAIIYDMHRANWLVKEQAHQLMQNVLLESIPDPAVMEECPVCEQPACRFTKCGTCGFNFVEDFRCPRMEPGRVCSCSGKLCEELGLEYETCEIFVESLTPTKNTAEDESEVSEGYLITST